LDLKQELAQLLIKATAAEAAGLVGTEKSQI
jgi:hypothetical protein